MANLEATLKQMEALAHQKSNDLFKANEAIDRAKDKRDGLERELSLLQASIELMKEALAMDLPLLSRLSRVWPAPKAEEPGPEGGVQVLIPGLERND